MPASTETLSPVLSRASHRLGDYLTLTKPEVTALVLVSTLIGFYLSSPAILDFSLLFHTLLGTALVAAGTATLNQFLERHIDARMRRTSGRPLPAGRLRPRHALAFGSALALTGTLYLFLTVNLLAAALAFFTLASYLTLYTPLKTRSSLCTAVGAFPGAVPPLVGWAAAAGSLSAGAWVLFALLFLWQFPHFLAIAWIYREDYARAGIKMLPVTDAGGAATGRHIVFYSALLLPVSLVPTVLGMVGALYFFGALAIGLALLGCGLAAALTRSTRHARRLLQATVFYLPFLFALLMLDRQL